MCKCTPEIRTPYCGKLGCEWPKSAKAQAVEVPVETYDQRVSDGVEYVVAYGPVDGTGARHPEGSYIHLVTRGKNDTRRVHRISRGAAEVLIAELQGSLSSTRA